MLKRKTTYLSIPPPAAGVHVEVDSHLVVRIGIMTLRTEDEDGSKFRISIEGANTLDDIAVENLECLARDDDFAAREARATRRELFIDYLVELLRVVE